MAVLTLENVSKSLSRRKIVHDVSMKVNEGEVYGFLGPNGAGKTTTIRMIVGLIRPDSGTIRIEGHDVQRDRGRALAHVGAIVENPEMYSYMTGRQNLVHYARLSNLSGRTPRVDEVADLVGLSSRIDDKVKRYSLGMRQRLGVAQALLADPKLLVLDEPTNGLDPAGMKEFRELIRTLAKSGISVFISSHLLSEIQQVCDRVAIIKDGRMITERQVSELVSGSVKTVHFTVGDVSAALSAFSAEQIAATQHGEKVIEVNMDAAEAPRLVKVLVEHAVDVFAVQPQADSLESMFMELTASGNLAQVGGERHA